MRISVSRARVWLVTIGFGVLAVGLVTLAAACGGEKPTPPPTPTQVPLAIATKAPPVVAAPTSQAPQATVATKVALKLLKAQPDGGYVGASFTITGEGLPSNKAAELLWVTSDGTFDTNAIAETVEFVGLRYTTKRLPLGKATTDSQGRLVVDLKAPVDYGGVHDIFVVMDGQDVARGGFQIRRSISVSPKEGPVGTPITISITGMGLPPVEHALAVRYDNQYSVYISGVTTRGVVTGYIRAAGPLGLHTIELSGAGNHGGGYLNNQQSPYASLFPKDGAFRFTFNVTADRGAPAAITEWPETQRVAQLASDAPRTTAAQVALSKGITAALNTSRGPILTPATVTASGLRPGAEVQMRWVTAKGNRVTAAGWELVETSMGTAKADANGSLSADIKVPDGLGGWHMLALAQDGAVVASVPFYVEQSLVGVTPTRVKAGEQFTVHLKGVGWTELDNTVAVTYDNAYAGYACGFNSNGDITLQVTATGAPGTHLVDIYPTTFQGKATGRWGFQMPQLTALQDHPGLQLGYNLPI
ncbi:MAG: hypothetical protein HYU29_02190, partial [Chloroflexi bacterium]|nr:hypothetical protein [Chloroflexota bacterium]